ncbi:hypothetical protein TNCV_2050001 [Trichonephila clavipes]|nr:hypothetical protein TNCV_2050001 [Trichonephila clavipes]
MAFFFCIKFITSERDVEGSGFLLELVGVEVELVFRSFRLKIVSVYVIDNIVQVDTELHALVGGVRFREIFSNIFESGWRRSRRSATGIGFGFNRCVHIGGHGVGGRTPSRAGIGSGEESLGEYPRVV